MVRVLPAASRRAHWVGAVTAPRVERIGEAELWLGDCREVLPQIEGADMIFTDPPYGHKNNNNDLIHRREAALGRLPSGEDTPQGRPIANDGAEANDLIQWAFVEFRRLLRTGSCCCCCCCCCGPDPQFARWSLWLDQHLDFKQMVVWDKGPMGMGWHYRRSYETVLVAQKPGAACRWFDETNAIENIIRPGAHGVRKIIPSAEDHPTPKPWQLAAHFIRLHSEPGDVVLDPFMGGNSTGEAAIREGRKFVGIEIDPEHFERSILRIEAAYRQSDMFVPRAPAPTKPVQETML